MGKLGVLAILALAAFMYFLKDKDLYTITKSTKELVKEGAIDAPRDGEFVPKWKYGNCIYENKDSWDHEKIMFVSKEEYKFVKCRKFKGCTTETESYPAVAYEKDRATYIQKPCN